MSRRGPEGKIQDAIIKYARTKYGALCKKNEVGKFFVGSGWPDYMMFKPLAATGGIPHMWFVEFKAPGKDLTPLQQEMRKQINTCGFRVHVISSVAAGKMIIDAECA